MKAEESGSALVETIAGMTLLMVMAIGTIQVASFLYARNALRSSAHEVARSALERGVEGSEAADSGARLVRESLGRNVHQVRVHVEARELGNQRLVTARVDAVLDPPGLFPVRVPVRSFVDLRGDAEPL